MLNDDKQRAFRTRPSDISKIFCREQCHSGDAKEPLRRRFNNFMNACYLSDVDTTNKEMMLKIIEIDISNRSGSNLLYGFCW